MRDLLIRMWANFGDRADGRMTFRLILQPTMAILLAFRDGMKDAREGRPPYFWTLLTHPAERVLLLREGWKSVARIFFLAVIMDVIYQLIVEHWVYPLEVVVVAILLAVVPYLFIRGPVNRLVRIWRKRRDLRD